jgi:raffinose/stachyose/melibiose transport system permease protein
MKQYKLERMKRELGFEIMLLPALVLYLIFCFYPFLTTFFYSITDYTNIHLTNLNFVGLSNFKDVFNNDLLLASIKNSIIYAILMTVFQTVFAIPLAIFLDRNLKTKNLLRVVFFMPAVFSSLIVGFLWNYMMSSSDVGLINHFLHSLGIPTVNFLGDSRLALYSVVITQLWQWTGWAMVIYLANLQSIPRDFYEAAEIDGANSWQSFWKITLPMLNPSVSVVAVTAMVGGLKVFDIIYALTQGGPGYSTETIMTAMIKKAFTDGNYAVGSAFGVVFFGIVMIISIVMMKLLGKWEAKLN